MKNRHRIALLAVSCLLFAATSFSADYSAISGLQRRGMKSTQPHPSSVAQKIAAPSYGTQLTATGVEKWDCDRSSDGTSIVFEDENSIYTISALGGDPVDFLPGNPDYCFNPRFTASGEGITYSRINNVSLEATFDFTSLDRSIHFVIAYDAANGCLSPDGNKAVYRSYTTGDLILLDLQTMQTSILAPGDWGYAPSCFTPSGGAVISSMDAGDGNLRLFRFPLNGGPPQQLTFHDGDHFSPDISPDGRWILYNTEYTYTSTVPETYFDVLFALDLTTTESTELFPESDRWHGYGRFSANGKRFTYLLDTNDVNEVYSVVFPLLVTENSLTLTSPNGGENLAVDSQQEITWQSLGISTIRIEYSAAPGGSWELIASGVDASTGSYSWTVPNKASTTCRVRITDESNATVTGSSAGDFEIASSSLTTYITINTPARDDVLQPGGTKYITWEAVGVNAFTLLYSTSGSGTPDWKIIAKDQIIRPVSSTYQYKWTVPQEASDLCYIRVESTDDISLHSISGPFTIGSGAVPSIVMLAPDGGEEWKIGTTEDIIWTSSGISAFAIDYSTDDGGSWTSIAASYEVANTTDTTAENIYSFQWEIPDTPSSACRVLVSDPNNSSIASMSANLFAISSAVSEPPLVMMYQTDGPIGFSSPAVDKNGTVYVASDDNFLYAISSDNTLVWRKDLGDAVWSSPVTLPDGTIYIGTMNSELFSLNSSGAFNWTYKVGDSIFATPSIAADGTVYVGSQDGWLSAINPNGESKWRVELSGPIYSSAAIGIDGTVYTACYDGTIHAVSLSGVKKWEFPTSMAIISSPAIASDGTLYIGSGGYLYALNPNRTLKWRTLLGSDVTSSPSIGPDGTIYVGVVDTYDICALDPVDGTVTWSYTTGGSINGSPAVGADGAIYIGSEDWKLYCFNPDGSIRWTYNTSDTIWSSPTISDNGIVYFGSYDGAIYGVDSETDEGLADSSWPKFHQGAFNHGRVRTLSTTYIQAAQPDGGETFVPGSKMDITWTSNDVTTVTLEFSGDTGQTWTPIAQDIPAASGSYSWLIPDNAASSQCYVRISDSTNFSVKDRSNNTFTISAQPFITVTKPIGGERWKAGEKRSIAWDASGVSQFTLQFSSDGGNTWTPFTSGLAAVTGSSAQSYSWTVPQALSANCIIRVADSADQSIRSDSGVFSIISSSFITVTSPALGDRWTTESVKDIAWEFNGVSDIKIELSIDNGVTWSLIKDSASTASGTYSWTVPNTPSDQNLIRLTSTGNTTITDVSDTFSIIRPELSIEHVPLTSAQENEAITFTTSVTATATIQNVRVHFDVTGSRDFLQPTHIMTMEATTGSQFAYTMEAGTFTAQGIEYYPLFPI